MKIRTKIFLTFLVSGLVLTTIGVSIFYYFSYIELKREIFNHLETAAKSEADHVNTYLTDKVHVAETLSTSITFVDLLSAYESRQNYQSLLIKVTDRINNLLEVRGGDLIDIHVLDKYGEIITSTKHEGIGTNRAVDEVFIGGLKEVTIGDIHIDKEYQKPVIVISAPIKQGENSLGVVMIKSNVDDLYEILGDNIGLGETGEIYLVNSEGYMISPSRFEEDIILKRRADTLNTQNCFTAKYHPGEMKEHEGHEAVEISLDYRDAEVIGSHIYIPNMEWCLLAEIDTEEALAPLKGLLNTAVVLGLLIIAIASLIAYWIGISISKPILALRRGAEIIKGGNLEHQIKIEAEDEIGELARDFDEMTKAIKESRAEVDKKVEKQTHEIRIGNRKLEEQQKAILNVLEDVQTEKDKVSKERDRITTILYSIGDGVFVVDENLKIVIFNQAAADISGFSEQEAVGKEYDQVLNFVYEKNSKKNDEFIKGAMTTGEVKEMGNHTLLIKKDGEKVSVADSAAPLKNKQGKVIGCVVVFRDVTEERKIDQAKSEFVSLASHQLRTPLTAISWFTELLLKEEIGKLNRKQKQYLKEVYVGNKRMISLVSSLLNVSRIELGTLAITPRPTDFIKVVKIAIKELASQIKKKKLKIETEFADLPEIGADTNLVKIVFQNLLSNAVKYTPEKGKIEVKLEKKDEDALFTVRDNGYGIPKDQQAKMFTKLFRADNIVDKETDGTGLGLYIVKEVVEQSGGKIWFESEENKGTTFYVAIPIEGMKAKEGTKGLTAVL